MCKIRCELTHSRDETTAGLSNIARKGVLFRECGAFKPCRASSQPEGRRRRQQGGEIPVMPRQSLVEYVREFSRHARGLAFGNRTGYRTVRWSYAEVAAPSAQFAGALE